MFHRLISLNEETLSVMFNLLIAALYHISAYFYATIVPLALACIWERGGIVVERRTPNREVLGLIPTSGTVLCP